MGHLATHQDLPETSRTWEMMPESIGILFTILALLDLSLCKPTENHEEEKKSFPVSAARISNVRNKVTERSSPVEEGDSGKRMAPPQTMFGGPGKRELDEEDKRVPPRVYSAGKRVPPRVFSA